MVGFPKMKMPAKSRKTSSSNTKSDSSRKSPNHRIDGSRKRTQNRIAQQCLRERRAASSRHMDNMFETMHFATETDLSQRYTVLLEAHMNLARENQLMEDALFRLRKKLLSLSNSTALAADDPVFDMMLGRENAREPELVITDTHEHCGDGRDLIDQQHPMGSPQTAADEPLPSASMGVQNDAVTANLTSNNTTLETPAYLEEFLDIYTGPQPIPETLGEIVVALDDASLDLLPYSADRQDGPELKKQPQQQPFTGSDDVYPQILADPLSFAEIHATSVSSDLPTSDGRAQPQQLASPWDICSTAPPQKLTVQSGNEFSNKVLQASFQCMSIAQWSGLARNLTTDQLTQQVAVAAVNLIGRASGMQQYLYGMVTIQPDRTKDCNANTDDKERCSLHGKNYVLASCHRRPRFSA